jgi:undecaprenyl-diphosphatase
LEEFNKIWFLTINAHAGVNHTLDFIIEIIAQYTPYLFVAGLFYLWFTHRKNEALFAGYATTLGIITNQIIGLFYYHPRPYMLNLGHTLLAHKNDSSFPSDHTTFLFSIAFMLVAFQSTHKAGIVAIVFSLACGVGRIYCGVHWPYDIIASIFVSLIIVSIIINFKSKFCLINELVISIWYKIFLRRLEDAK